MGQLSSELGQNFNVFINGSHVQHHKDICQRSNAEAKLFCLASGAWENIYWTVKNRLNERKVKKSKWSGKELALLCIKYKEGACLRLVLFVAAGRNLLTNYSLISCWFRSWGHTYTHTHSDKTDVGKMNLVCCFLLVFIYKKLPVQTDGLLSCLSTSEKKKETQKSTANKPPWNL